MLIRLELPRDKSAPAAARQAIDELRPVPSTQVRSDARLLVSELVTNSVKYGSEGALRLQISAPAPTQVRVEVTNEGDSFEPKARNRPVTEAGGWGLHLVEELTDRWGVHEGSTHVWFEIDR